MQQTLHRQHGRSSGEAPDLENNKKNGGNLPQEDVPTPEICVVARTFALPNSRIISTKSEAHPTISYRVATFLLLIKPLKVSDYSIVHVATAGRCYADKPWLYCFSRRRTCFHPTALSIFEV